MMNMTILSLLPIPNRFNSRMKISISTHPLILLILLAVISSYPSPARAAIFGAADYVEEDSYNLKFSFIPFAGKCKLPTKGEPLEPHETCDEDRGLMCQQYREGTLCGCHIQSVLVSYDRGSGECRRMPGEHCIYVNKTINPTAYDKLNRNFKCHKNAECVKRLIRKEMTGGDVEEKEVSVCLCSEGYYTSRDGLECVSVNGAAKGILITPINLILGLAVILAISR